MKGEIVGQEEEKLFILLQYGWLVAQKFKPNKIFGLM